MSRMKLRVLLLSCSILLCASACEDGSGNDETAGAPVTVYCVEETLACVSDSLGQLTVSDMASCGDELYVLDCPEALVRVYSRGELVRSFGERGSGPGMLSWPSFLCVLSDSAVLISDMGAGGLCRFDSEGGWIGTPVEYQSNPMMDLEMIDCSTFAAYKHTVVNAGGRPAMSLNISAFDVDGNRIATFHEDSFIVEASNPTELFDRSLFAYRCGGGNGLFFLYDRNGPEYLISCHDRSGGLLDSISVEVPVVQKTEAEIDAEAQDVTSYLRSIGSSNVVQYSYDPRPYREPVMGIWITVDDEIWVLRGDLESPRFDVFEYPSLELSRVVNIDMHTEGTRRTELHVSSSGQVFALIEMDDFSHTLLQLSEARRGD